MRRLASPTPVVLALVAAGLWPWPVFGVLHAEASAVVAGAAFFASGLAALGAFAGQPVAAGRGAFARVLRREAAALAVPWAMLTASLAWAPNAGYAQGLLLFVVFTLPSVTLAVALAWALAGARVRRKRLAFAGIGLAVLVGSPLYDLGLHPQFYHYSHVFGGVLGPIYDEELALRPGLFVFRGLTLLWALGLYLAGRRLRGDRGAARTAALVALVIGGMYAASGWLGFNTPAWRIERALGGHVRTAHFDLYFSPASTPPERVRRLARDHEYRYAVLAARLGVRPAARVRSYVYPDVRTKAALVGAGRTDVAPVWLARPQTHVLAEHFEGTFGHELVHAFSREFGVPFVRASRYVGLVEGLAVAFEGADGLPAPHEQVSAAARASGDTLLAERLAGSLGAGGFWTARGAVSYTTAGSFVRFLADRYGADRVRQMYAWGDFEGVYGRPIGALAAEWERYVLHDLPAVALAAGPLARSRFGAPSLFERPSPHHVPRHVRSTRRAAALLAASDTAGALARLDDALARAPGYAPALALWADVRLAQGQARTVARRLARASDAALAVRHADALVLAGHADAARARYAGARAGLPVYAHAAAVEIALRARLAAHPDALAARYARRGWPSADADPDAAAAFAVLDALRAVRPADAYRRLLAAPWPASAFAGAGLRARAAAQRAAWLAALADEAGFARPADRHAREAAARFDALGDLGARDALLDLAARARFTFR